MNMTHDERHKAAEYYVQYTRNNTVGGLTEKEKELIYWAFVMGAIREDNSSAYKRQNGKPKPVKN